MKDSDNISYFTFGSVKILTVRQLGENCWTIDGEFVDVIPYGNISLEVSLESFIAKDGVETSIKSVNGEGEFNIRVVHFYIELPYFRITLEAIDYPFILSELKKYPYLSVRLKFRFSCLNKLYFSSLIPKEKEVEREEYKKLEKIAVEEKEGVLDIILGNFYYILYSGNKIKTTGDFPYNPSIFPDLYECYTRFPFVIDFPTEIITMYYNPDKVQPHSEIFMPHLPAIPTYLTYNRFYHGYLYKCGCNKRDFRLNMGNIVLPLYIDIPLPYNSDNPDQIDGRKATVRIWSLIRATPVLNGKIDLISVPTAAFILPYGFYIISDVIRVLRFELPENNISHSSKKYDIASGKRPYAGDFSKTHAPAGKSRYPGGKNKVGPLYLKYFKRFPFIVSIKYALIFLDRIGRNRYFLLEFNRCFSGEPPLKFVTEVPRPSPRHLSLGISINTIDKGKIIEDLDEILGHLICRIPERPFLDDPILCYTSISDNIRKNDRKKDNENLGKMIQYINEFFHLFGPIFNCHYYINFIPEKDTVFRYSPLYGIKNPSIKGALQIYTDYGTHIPLSTKLLKNDDLEKTNINEIISKNIQHRVNNYLSKKYWEILEWLKQGVKDYINNFISSYLRLVGYGEDFFGLIKRAGTILPNPTNIYDTPRMAVWGFHGQLKKNEQYTSSEEDGGSVPESKGKNSGKTLYADIGPGEGNEVSKIKESGITVRIGDHSIDAEEFVEFLYNYSIGAGVKDIFLLICYSGAIHEEDSYRYFGEKFLPIVLAEKIRHHKENIRGPIRMIAPIREAEILFTYFFITYFYSQYLYSDLDDFLPYLYIMMKKLEHFFGILFNFCGEEQKESTSVSDPNFIDFGRWIMYIFYGSRSRKKVKD